jgi:hypothetical protein
MKTFTLIAGDESVVVALRDPNTGSTVVETEIQAGASHTFTVEDGVIVEPIDELTPDPSLPKPKKKKAP